MNGVKVVIPGYTGGFCLDSCTTVMLEPQNGIWDLYTSSNLVLFASQQWILSLKFYVNHDKYKQS